jgi:hypothetical protein
MSEIELSIALPLDPDGFLRRECPACERELKWIPARDDEEATQAPDSGFFCPYCAVQAPADAWWTPAQLEAAEAHAYQEVLKPKLDEVSDSARRAAGGFVSVEIQRTEPELPLPLSESGDMRRVDFPCHPGEPVKVLDDWSGPVHCMLCGTAAELPRG